MGKPGPRPMGKAASGDPWGGNMAPPADPIQRMAQSLRGTSNTIVVEGYASAADKDKNAASLDRANRLREQLVRNGVDPSKVVALGKGEQQGRGGGARIVEAPNQQAQTKNDDGKKEREKSAAAGTRAARGSPAAPAAATRSAPRTSSRRRP